MRKILIGAVVGVIALVGASLAFATGTVQKYTETFGTKGKARSTSTILSLTSTDPTNTAHNNAPDPARQLVIQFPKGTDVEPTAVPACSATSLDFQNKGTAACPSNTLIGTGTASANSTFSNVGEISATVTAFNGKKKQLLLYVKPSRLSQPFTIVAQLSGSKRSGFKLTTRPPLNCLPPGNASQGCPNGEAPLDSFKLTTKARKGKVHGKKVGFISTPAKCPKSKNWTFIVTISYKTDPTKTFRSNSPCKR